jgi:hypothetical protein
MTLLQVLLCRPSKAVTQTHPSILNRKRCLPRYSVYITYEQGKKILLYFFHVNTVSRTPSDLIHYSQGSSIFFCLFVWTAITTTFL